MLGRLFLLFTVVPALELFLLLQIGSVLGPLATFLLIVVTGAVGATVARQQGVSVLTRLQAEVQQGQPPTTRLVEGALIVAGGLLLVTPGVVTDLVGFSLVLPPTRQRIAPWLVRRVGAGLAEGNWQVHVGAPRTPRARPPEPESSEPPSDPGSPFEHPVA